WRTGPGSVYQPRFIALAYTPGSVVHRFQPKMRFPTACVLLATLAASVPALGQEARRSVRTGYAHVLRVEPVYQTLTATRMEQHCDGKPVKEAAGGDDGPPSEPAAPLPPNCEMVPVQRQFQRPIAYDVDYVYRGLKYRSRLPYDPGNRLRVQVSIQPYVAPPGSD